MAEAYLFYMPTPTVACLKACALCTPVDGVPARFRCAKCKSIRYCSSACQTKDWRDHRAMCNYIARLRSKATAVMPTASNLPKVPLLSIYGMTETNRVLVIWPRHSMFNEAHQGDAALMAVIGENGVEGDVKNYKPLPSFDREMMFVNGDIRHHPFPLAEVLASSLIDEGLKPYLKAIFALGVQGAYAIVDVGTNSVSGAYDNASTDLFK